jgi:hypothetical protein
MGAVGEVTGAPSNWRHLIDFVADIDPTAALRFLLNVDYRTEDNVAADHSEVVFGGNLVARYNFSDAFNGAIRGEYYHDEHGDTLGTGTKTDIEDFTLSLNYGIGNHLAFMFDNRLDLANNAIFPEKTPNTFTKTQFISTLGIIASTK